MSHLLVSYHNPNVMLFCIVIVNLPSVDRVGQLNICCDCCRMLIICSLETMDSHRQQLIYDRIQREFNVNTFHRKYYCEKLMLEALRETLLGMYPSATLLVRFDHIVVKDSDGTIVVYLLVSHSTGRCAPIHH